MAKKNQRPMQEAVLALTPTRSIELGYARVCEMRQAAYAEHLAAMAPSPPLEAWGAFMAERYGSRVKVHLMIHTNWLIALLVVRYGEAVEHWPEAFSDADARRADLWARGTSVPAGIEYLEPPKPTSGRVLVAVLLLMGLLAAAFGWGALLALPILGSALTNYMEDQMVTHLFRTGLTTINNWQASTSYSVGDIVQAVSWNDRLFECVVAGTSGGSEPSWNTALGAEQVDNTVTWQTIAVGVPKRPLYFALFTAAPGETGGGTEVSAGGYARVARNPLDANWNASSNGLTDNAADITLGPPSADWGVVTHMAIFNRLTGGDMLIYAVLTASRDIKNGDTVRFAAGDMDVTFA